MSFFKCHQCLDGFGQAEIQEVALDTVSRILKLKQSPVRTQTKVYVFSLKPHGEISTFYCLMASIDH
jgi:hypothetical protein